MRLCASLVALAILSVPAAAFADTINLSTGYAAPVGSVDPHYTVTYSATSSTPTTGGTSTYVLTPNTNWGAQNTYSATGANWIGANPNSNTANDPGGYYTYTATFTGSFTQLSGNFAADNAATVYLNGVVIASNTYGPPYGFSSFTSFNDTTDLVSGTNTLQFVVQNGNFTTDTQGPEGLIANVNVTPTPEPSSLLLLGSGLASVGAVVRRRIVRS